MLNRLNQTWFDTVALLGQQMSLTKEQRADGWPDAFKPEQIAVLQRPYKWWPLKDREHEKGRLCAAYRDGLNAALASGKLPSIIKTERVVAHYEERFKGYKGNQFTGALQEVFANVPVYGDKEFHYIAAPAFAAWLAAQGETPSAHVQNWLNAVGVAGAAKNAPVALVNSTLPDESLDDRNLRWLNHYEIEERTAKRGAYNRTAAHFDVNPSTLRKAVDKAMEQRTERRRAGFKTVPAKSKATPFSGLVTHVKDGRKTTKNQL